MIIGGSSVFYGAPLMCSLGAEYSGVDLVFPVLPKQHLEVAKTYSLNFILQHFKEDNFSQKDVKALAKASQSMDCVVIGPGLGKDGETKAAAKELLGEIKVPTVVDAGALVYSNNLPETCIFTPHRGEFRALTGEEPHPENIQKWARDMGIIIVCKGPEDIIANKDEVAINTTGNAMMTVGGTGDVLAGLIGGLIAQKIDAFEACKIATRILGETAEGYEGMEHSLRAVDLAYTLPIHLAKLEVDEGNN